MSWSKIREKIFNRQQLESYQFPNPEEDCGILDTENVNTARKLLKDLNLNIFLENYKKFLTLFYDLDNKQGPMVKRFIADIGTELEKTFEQIYHISMFWFNPDLESNTVQDIYKIFTTVPRDGQLYINGLQIGASRLFQPLTVPEIINSNNLLTVIVWFFPIRLALYYDAPEQLRQQEIIQNSFQALIDKINSMDQRLRKLSQRAINQRIQQYLIYGINPNWLWTLYH